MTLSECQAIAEIIVGRVEWDGARGFCQCPGKSLHSTRDGARDCWVRVVEENGITPTVWCLHDKCKDAVALCAKALQSALARAQLPEGFQRPAFTPRPPPRP